MRSFVLPDPPLQGPGWTARPWRSVDAPALAGAWRDPEVARWCAVPASAGPGGTSGLVAAERWIAGEADRRARGLALDLAIVASPGPPGSPSSREGLLSDPGAHLPHDGDGGLVCGEVGLSHWDRGRQVAEIGFWVAAEQRGCGLATAAAVALTAWALASTAGGGFGLDAVFARTSPVNAGSVAVLIAAGFERRGGLASGDDLYVADGVSHHERSVAPR